MELHLSKSKYCNAVQCPKMLWMKKNKPEEFDESVMDQVVLDNGSEVGDLAMGLFGDYVEVPFDRDLGKMIKKTEELLEAGTSIICEASFSYEGLFCSVDILKNLGGRSVELYEVKSSTEVKDIYTHDVAYQVYVLSKLGFTVERACLVHLNNQYCRHGELDLQQLFRIVDLTTEARTMQSDVEHNLEVFAAYMSRPDEPQDDLHRGCFKPYSCGFWKYCSRDLPKPNVFDLHGPQKTTMLKCYYQGLISFADLNGSDRLNAKTYQQVEHELYGYPPAIKIDTIKTFLSRLSYPLYFLDFETFSPAIPIFDDSKPYAKIPFQYSLHWIEQEGGELKHTEYLAYPGKDPRRELAEQLCRDIPMDVCTTAYNMGFEKGRIKELAALYPDLANHLMNIHDHIEDLMIPFRERWYYSRSMQGSYSIKYVLPALYPDDPALDYHNLEGVHNGGEAMDVFQKMSSMPPEELETWRKHLLKYCELDTYAMVKVWERLKEVIM